MMFFLTCLRLDAGSSAVKVNGAGRFLFRYCIVHHQRVQSLEFAAGRVDVLWLPISRVKCDQSSSCDAALPEMVRVTCMGLSVKE